MELEEAKKILFNCYAMRTKHELDDENKALKQAIEIVLKELDRMQEEISERIKLKVENERLVDKEFIYKGKIREKIEELEELKKQQKNCFDIDEFLNLDMQTDLLKKLLEEK